MNEENVLEIEQGTEMGTDGGESAPADAPVAVPVVEYTLENPMPVKVIEEPQVFDGEVFAAEGSDYGTISSQYLDYFTGIVEKLPHDAHYVIWKSGDYSYSIAYGEDMELTDALVSGYDLDCVRIYRQTNNGGDWLTKTETLENLELHTEQLFVYSDLGKFPTVERGWNNAEVFTVLFSVGFAVVFSVCNRIFDYVLKHVYRR